MTEAEALQQIIVQALFLVPRDECGEFLRQHFTWYVQCRRRQPEPLRPAERQAIRNNEMRRRVRRIPYAADPGASDAEIVAEADMIEARRYLTGQ